MSGSKAAPAVRKLSHLQDEIDAELRHVRDLVYVRELLAARGAAAEELRECDAVIDGLRQRLAESAQRASAELASAA
jgi:hypothetical protein